MLFHVVHDLPGRMRARLADGRLTPRDAVALRELLLTQDGILDVRVSARTGSVLLRYRSPAARPRIAAMLRVLAPEDWDGFAAEKGGKPSVLALAVSGALDTGVKLVLRSLLPWPIRCAWILACATPYFIKGLASLLRGRLDLAVLDAAALAVMAWRRDFAAMRTVLLLFAAAEALEGWTRESSRDRLAESLALKIDRVWIKTEAGTEIAIRLAQVRPGHRVVMRLGAVIPVDGVVEEGEALVNEATLTGESRPRHGLPGVSVFAGSAVEEGGFVMRVTKAADDTRLREIVRFIEDSEALKAQVQSRAERFADALVPYNLLLTLVVLAATRDPARAASALMVDYSCGIRMATPLAILGAIREGVRHGVLVKGGRYLEALSTADHLVLDKTGTLTLARPRLAAVRAFDGWTGTEVLRTAACIEEHFPHPVARTVVRAAERRGLRHRERHAEPEYILAHGVVSRLDGQPVLIGSAHFVFEDRGVPRDAAVEDAARAEADRGRSLLYLAVGGRVVGVLAIEDPVREEAPAVLTALAGQGMKGPTMLTGDDDRTARAVAARLGIADFRAGLLPVDKARLVERLQSAGCRVLFVGDGINDAPALSASHVGVSLRDGADLAKEIAGVVLMDGRLSDLLVARMLAANAMTRVRRQFGFIMGVNSVLMALGLAGVISPRLAALLHNLTTVGATANSLRPLLPGPAAEASAMPSGPATARGARTGASADREPAAMTAAAFGDGA